MSAGPPHLQRALRRFCLGAFALLVREVEAGAELPFSFEEHRAPGRPSLYEYRPLTKAFVEERAERLRALEDAGVAVEELSRLPQAAIYARAHAGAGTGADDAVFRTVLLPLVTRTAEARGGFDWDDEAFDRAYRELGRSLFGAQRTYAAAAPLVGLAAATAVDLGDGVRVRPAEPGELASHWPEATGLLPKDFGRELDRFCLLEVERPLAGDAAEPPDGPAELADAVTAIRLATAGAVAAGPVAFERLDWRPYGIRPVLPIAAAVPAGEPTRLDSFRGRIARDVRERLVLADEDPELEEALDRWELSLLAAPTARGEHLRSALSALLGAGEGHFAAALRAAQLLGDSARHRAELLTALRTLGTDGVSRTAADAVRRALVEAVLYGNRGALVAALDESLLGLRPRPAAAFAVHASAR